MKNCDWKKLKRKSLSLSEWQCLKCGKIGYASHDKPPVNCLRTIFGVNVNSSTGSNTNLLNKITRTKVGGYSLSFVIVGLLIVSLAVFSQYKCNIYLLIGLDSAYCGTLDVVDEIYNEGASAGLKDIDGTYDLCDGASRRYVDPADLQEYFGMLKSEIVFLDNAINGDPLKYLENYRTYTGMNKLRVRYSNEKIDNMCVSGDKRFEIVEDMDRMQKFISQKYEILYDLSKK